MFFDSILFIDCYLSDANRKRLVSHFANMLYIGAVLTVFTVIRLALLNVKVSKASLQNISRLAFLVIALRKPS